MYNFCKIVQDLLPNYMEKTTFDETNQFIEEHLEQCEECTRVYNNMKSNLEVPTENIDKGVDYMKKVNKEVKHLKFWKKVLIVIASIIGILAGIVLYRYSVLTNLYNLEVKNSKFDNFYYEQKSGNVVIKQYQKNNVMKMIKEGTLDADGNIKTWKNLNTGEAYMIIENSKQYLEVPAGFPMPLAVSFVDDRLDTIIKRIKLALDINFSIKTVKYNNKDCYKIIETKGDSNHNLEKIYEKSTGLTLFVSDTLYQSIGKNEEYNKTYITWDIGNVTDEQISKTDLSQYEYTKNTRIDGITGEVIEY